MFAQMPVCVYRHFNGTTSSDGRRFMGMIAFTELPPIIGGIAHSSRLCHDARDKLRPIAVEARRRLATGAEMADKKTPS
jgi:hypothetical protein